MEDIQINQLTFKESLYMRILKNFSFNFLFVALILGFTRNNFYSDLWTPFMDEAYNIPIQNPLFAFKETKINDGNEDYLFNNQCSDLLQEYAEKPMKLEFVDCRTSTNNIQTIAHATYRVSGKDAQGIEDFLIEKYQMGELQWVCCGWENDTKCGQFEHPELLEIDPYCSGMIQMFTKGITDHQEYFQKSEVEYFTVIVELVIV